MTFVPLAKRGNPPQYQTIISHFNEGFDTRYLLDKSKIPSGKNDFDCPGHK